VWSWRHGGHVVRVATQNGDVKRAVLRGSTLTVCGLRRTARVPERSGGA
jgi:hypothetical protein